MKAQLEVQPNAGSHILVSPPPEDCNHDWPTGLWGVILDIARCRKCKIVAREEHFTGEVS